VVRTSKTTNENFELRCTMKKLTRKMIRKRVLKARMKKNALRANTLARFKRMNLVYCR